MDICVDVKHAKSIIFKEVILFHELPSAILIKDIEDDYRFYIINKKFEQMCNLPKELLIGKTDYEAVSYTHLDVYKRQEDVPQVCCPGR